MSELVPAAGTGSAAERGALQFEFTLKYELDEHAALIELVMNRLEQSGCTDALVGASVKGVIELQFVREASTAAEALAFATASMKRAFPLSRLVGIVPAPDTPVAD